MESFDINLDNLISFTEFRNALQPLLVGISDKLLRELFDKWDLDSSSTLAVDEFVSGLFQDRADFEFHQEKKQIDCIFKAVFASKLTGIQ